jgi:hypothetical protein
MVEAQRLEDLGRTCGRHAAVVLAQSEDIKPRYAKLFTV